MNSTIKAESALASIPCAECDYNTWKNLAMAFRDAGGTLAAWDAWCRSDLDRYDEKAARDVYTNPEVGVVRGGGRPITARTLWMVARQHGWIWGESRKAPEPEGFCSSHRDVRSLPVDCMPLPMGHLSPAEQAAAQITALFDTNESVCVVTKARPDKHGRLRPAEGGKMFNADDLVAKLRDTNDIEAALGCP